MKRPAVHAAIAIAALATPSCSLLFGVKDRCDYYSLHADPSPPLASRPALRAHVRSVRIPGYLNRDEMVYRTGPNELKIFDGKVWGDSLDKGIARNIAASLRHLLGTSQIVALDSVIAAENNYGRMIDIEVTRFERQPDGTARFEGIYAIKDPEAATAAVTRSFSYSEPIQGATTGPVTGASADATVNAMNACLNRLTGRIGRDLLHRPPAAVTTGA